MQRLLTENMTSYLRCGSDTILNVSHVLLKLILSSPEEWALLSLDEKGRKRAKEARFLVYRNEESSRSGRTNPIGQAPRTLLFDAHTPCWLESCE